MPRPAPSPVPDDETPIGSVQAGFADVIRRTMVERPRGFWAVMSRYFVYVGLTTIDGVLIDMADDATPDGATRDSVVGRPIWMTAWWSGDAAEQQALERAVRSAAGGEAVRYQSEMRGIDGRSLTVDLQILPLADGDSTVAGLLVTGRDVSERRRFQQDLAELAALEETQRVQAESLFGLAGALAAAASVDDVSESVAEFGAGVVGAEVALLGIVDPTGGGLDVHRGSGLEPESVPLDDRNAFGRAIRSRGPVILSTEDEVRALGPIGARGYLSSFAALPVGRGRAALGFGWLESVEFSADRLRSLGTVTGLVGQTLDRAIRYEREHRVADRLQRSLLPDHLPSIDGVEVAARYEAGATGLQVGGDWYDVATVDGGRHVFVVGDVVGRGLQAAATMGQMRTAFAALAGNEPDLGPLVEQLDVFSQEMDDARFGTLVAAEIDPVRGVIRVICAGHPPPIVRRADGTIEYLPDGGPPLGFRTDIARLPIRMDLDEGDAVVLYTDGLVERRGESIDVGLARLAEVASTSSAASASDLCDAVCDALGSADDDIALIVVLVSPRADP